MATAPRRETLIALRARRTAHRVATDLFLFQHTKPLTIDCAKCGQPFFALKDEKICPNCIEIVPDPSLPHRGSRPVTVCKYWGYTLGEMWSQTTWGEWIMLGVFFCCVAVAIWALFHAQPR